MISIATFAAFASAGVFEVFPGAAQYLAPTRERISIVAVPGSGSNNASGVATLKEASKSGEMDDIGIFMELASLS